MGREEDMSEDPWSSGQLGSMEEEVTSLGIRRFEFEIWRSPWTSSGPQESPASVGGDGVSLPSLPLLVCPDLLHWLLHEPGSLFWPRSGHETVQLHALGESKSSSDTLEIWAWRPGHGPEKPVDLSGCCGVPMDPSPAPGSLSPTFIALFIHQGPSLCGGKVLSISV